MNPLAPVSLHPGWFFMAGCLFVQQLAEIPTLKQLFATLGIAGPLWQASFDPLWQIAVVPLSLSLLGFGLIGLARAFGTGFGQAGALTWPILSFLAGFFWASLQADAALKNRLPLPLEGERLVLRGFVDGLVRHEQFPPSASFPLRVQACVQATSWCPVGSTVLVKINASKFSAAVSTRASHNNGAPPAAASAIASIRAGSVWHMDLRLKALHAQRNPGGSDLERLALQSDWVARGAAPESHIEKLEDIAMHPLAWVHRAREQLRLSLRASFLAGDPDRSGQFSGRDPDNQSATSPHLARAMAVIEALVIGSGEGLDPEQWDAFNRTGVGHLLSISGSHVTMFAGFSAFFGVGLLRLVGASNLLSMRWHTMAVPRVLFASFGAIAYTLIAGFGLPAQRTCAMVLVTGLMSLSGRRHAPQAVLSCAGVIVCLIDPWAVVSAGFWLSFAAVAALVLSGQAMERPINPEQQRSLVAWQSIKSSLHEAFRGQWAASVAMIPLSVLFFAQISWVAPFANALAIPWIGFVITPASLLLAFVASISSSLAALPLYYLSVITEKSLTLLDGMAQWTWISSHSALPPEGIIAIAVIACVMLIWPLAPWPRWAVALLLLPLMFWPDDRPAEGELRILFFDVGQGSAVLVQSPKFSLLYDSGPAWSLDARSDGRNAGFQSILPVLRSRGIESLDLMVLSHADLDHTGGALSLQRHLRIGQILSGSPNTEPSLGGLDVKPCHRGVEIIGPNDQSRPARDGVEQDRGLSRETRLRFLHPSPPSAPQAESGLQPVIEAPTLLRKVSRNNRNAHSCVLLIEHQGRSLLLPGDLPALQEASVLLHEPAEPGRALDVLLLGHHGAANSSAAIWLDYWKPAAAIVQSGYQNRYGHPQRETLNRLCERTIPLRRTDLEGAIEIHIGVDGEIRWQNERNRVKRYWTRLIQPSSACQREPANQSKEFNSND